MDEPDPRTSVDFEPAAIEPGARRRAIPALVSATIVTLAIVVAIAKPWDAAPPRPSVAPPSGPTATPPTATRPVAAPTLDLSADGVGRLLDVVGPEDAWGAVAISASVNGVEVAWQPITMTDGGPVAPLAVVDPTPLHVLGITAPAFATPLDIRAWARGHDGQWHWLDAGRVASVAPGSDLLLAPPRIAGAALPAWPPGRYRLDLLMGPDIARVDVTVQRDAPPPDAPVATWSPGATIDDDVPAETPAGPFAIADGRVVHLDAEVGGTMSAAEAWYGGPRVASTWLPGATTLGVIFPPGARDPSAVIRRLVPEEGFAGPVTRVGTTANGRPLVRYDMPDTYRFEPGTYAIDARWIDDGVPQAGSWHIELSPVASTDRVVPRMLLAARAFAPFAGDDGLVADGAGRAARPVVVPAEVGGAGCDATDDGVRLGVVGITHPVAAPPAVISLEHIGTGVPATPISVRVASSVIPGLTIMVPRSTWDVEDGSYRVTVVNDAGRRSYVLCVRGAADDE